MQEQISLYFKQGSSNKVYHIQLVETPAGFNVNFQYGPNGGTLTSGTKTATPVDYAKAKKVYDKVVAEKRGKGYTVGESGVPFQASSFEASVSGYIPQLLNPIDEKELESYFKDDAWGAQEKMDGERRMAQIANGVVEGINRKGLVVSLPLPIVQDALTFSSGTVVDGEQIGNVLYVFDMLKVADKNVQGLSFARRFNMLEAWASSLPNKTPAIKVVDLVVGEDAKRALFARLKAENKEGIVFKRLDAEYTPGRPSSGGNQIKFKFTDRVTAFVLKVNEGKRSVSMGLYDESGKEITVGNVTILPNFDIPAVGQLIEVQYLYAYSGGSLYQPVYLGPRLDIEKSACTLERLKFKPAGLEDDEV